MSTKINHNVLSMTALRAFHRNQLHAETALTRLSSGLRINNAWDDPAGLGISERFRAQIVSMTEAEHNANSNMNFVATAEGALSTIDDILIRMKGLSIQAANGTMIDADRNGLNVEFQQLKSEITRIASTTAYGGLKMLDGSYSSSGIKFHIGIANVSNEDYYFVTFNAMRASDLGIGNAELLTTASAQTAIGMLDTAINSKDAERVRLGSYVERLQHTISSYLMNRESAVKAESDIRDADIALEMADFTRAQILMQTGVAMLSQANMLPQIVAGLVG